MIRFEADTQIVELQPFSPSAQIKLLVVNESNLIDYFALSLNMAVDNTLTNTAAIEPAWLNFAPPAFDLRPLLPGSSPQEGENQQTILLNINLPIGILAGTYTGQLVVTARSGPDNNAVLPLTIIVAQVDAQTLALTPPELTSRRKQAIFQVLVSNQSNAPHHYALYAEDDDDKCQFELKPDEIELGPGQQATLSLKVQPHHRNRLENNQFYPFAVKLENLPEEITGNFTQECQWPAVVWLRQRLTGFVPPLLIILALLLAAIIIVPNFFKTAVAADCGPTSLRAVNVTSNGLTTQIYVSDRGGGPANNLVATEPASFLPGLFASLVSVSPDGRRLAYVTAQNPAMDAARIVILDLTTLQKQTVAFEQPPTGLWPTAPIWSADGKQLAFVSRPAPAAAKPAATTTAASDTASVAATSPTPAPDTTTNDHLELWLTQTKDDKTFEPAKMLAQPDKLAATQFYGNNSRVVCWSNDTKTLIVRPKTAATETSFAQDEISLPDGKVSETKHQRGNGVAQAASQPSAPPTNSCPLINPISQNDPRWATTILRNGNPGRLDDYGCAVTAAAILLNSYSQDNLTPVDVLNNCLGDMAAPLLPPNWSQIGQNRCATSKLKGGTRTPFRWEDLNANLKNGPALVGLIGGQTGTQFLVVTNGSNNLADTYNVVDPWDGSTYKTLGYFLSKGYYLGWLVTYTGQSAGCNAAPNGATPVDITLDGVQDGGLYRGPQTVKVNVSGTDLITATAKFTGPQGTLPEPSLNKLILSNNQSYPFAGEGSYSIMVQAQNPGNASTTDRTVHFSIDTTPPVITPTLVPALPDPATKKYINPVTVNFLAIDTLSGVASVEYKINQGNWQLYTSDTTPTLITFKDNGSYDISYRATDGAGNISQVGLLHIEIEIPATRQTGGTGTGAGTAAGGQNSKTPGTPRPGATTGAAVISTTLPAGVLPTVTPNAAPAISAAAGAITTTTSVVPSATPTKVPTTVAPLPTVALPTAPPVPTTPPTAFVPPPPPTPVPLTPGGSATTVGVPITGTNGGPVTVTNTVGVPITQTQALNPVLAVSVQLNFPPGITTQLLTLNNNGNAPLTYSLVPGASANLLSFSQLNGTIAPGSSAVVNVNLLAPNLGKQNLITSFQINSSAGNQTVTAVISPGTVSSAFFAAPTDGSTLAAQTVIKLTVNNPNATQVPDHATIIATYQSCATCAAAPVTLPTKATAASGWQISWDTSKLPVQSGISLSGKLCFSTDDSNCSDIPPVANLVISAGANFSAPAPNTVLQANTQIVVQGTGRANHVIVTVVYQNNSVVLPDQPNASNNWTITWNTLNIPPNVPVTLKGQVCSSSDASNCQDIAPVSGLTTKLQAQVTFSQDLNANKNLPTNLGVTVAPVTNASNGASNINHVSLYATYQSSGSSSPGRQLLSNVILNSSTTPPWQASWNTAGIPAQSNITLEVLACFSTDESICQSLATYTGLQIAAATASTLTIIQGSGQSVQINSTFGSVLKVRVSDASNNPVVGATVIFQAPASGASGTFSGNLAYTAQTDSTGTASSGPFQANAIAGSYSVTATVSGSNASVSLQLSNVQSNALALQPTSGTTPQSTTILTKFGVRLQVLVRDSSNMPVVGAVVTFIAPNGGVSGTFANSSFAYTASTDATGTATALDFTANATLGTYSVVATSPGYSPAYFQLTNLAGTPYSITATAGTPQSAPISTTFATPLTVKVVDAGNNPLQGVVVTFQAPTSGASGTFGGGAVSATATTNSSGIATAPTFTANAIAGGPYNVIATVNGVNSPATFQLTNTVGGAASITPTTGNAQSAVVSTTFTTNLSVIVKDSGGNPLSGISVTFQAPTSGASGTFASSTNAAAKNIRANASNIATVTSNAQGIATAPAFTANGTAGTYTITATAPGASSAANFQLTNTAGPPAYVIATAGTPQSAPINTTFATNLAATVTDAGGNPVSGVVVTFSAPVPPGGTPTPGAFGSPSGTFAGGSTSATATTNVNGIATAPAFTANSTLGSYTVTATASGLNNPANFQLTNQAGVPASITATGGNNQSTPINATFETSTVAQVRDNNNSPLSGIVVTFQAPTSGASGTFAGGGTTATVTTNSGGYAIAPAFTANGTAGTYNVTATVSGVTTPATFTLTNLAGPPAAIVATAGTPQSTPISTTFATNLAASVTDSGGNPVAGVTVTFQTPLTYGDGTSATFPGGVYTVTVTTNAGGIATAPPLTANTFTGTYNVTAMVSGVGTSANYTLTNQPGPPASIYPYGSGSTPQSTQINTAFGTALSVVVYDSGSNALAGVIVNFQAPSSGASGTFVGGSTSATVTTNAGGIATAPTFTANGTAGTYNVLATVTGVSTPAVFQLTNNNLAPSVASISSVQTQAGGSGFTLTVNGSNFVNSSTVYFGSTPLATTFVNANQLTAVVPASALQSNGPVAVTVINPAPGGGTSGSQTFQVRSLTVGSYGLTCTESGFATALNNATALGGGTITFTCPNPTTIPLNVEYQIPPNTTIHGGAAGQVILSVAVATARVVNSNPNIILQNLEFTTAVTNTTGVVVNFGGPLTINNSLFSGINTTLFCLYDDPGKVLTVSNTVFASNVISATPSIEGCISNWGTTTIVSSTFSSTFGSAIVNSNGTLSIVSSNFTNNNSVLGVQGGAIENDSSLNVSNSTFVGNSSSQTAGAIRNLDNIPMTISNSTFNNNVNNGNSDGGAIISTGNVTITNSQFNNNSTNLGSITNGGAIANGFSGSVPGNLTVSGSTFQNNNAYNGGGISNYGVITLTTSSFYTNTANIGSGSGGSIINFSTLTLTRSTFQGNRALFGGAITNGNGNNLTIGNSTFAGNTGIESGTVSNFGNTSIINSTIASTGNYGLESNAGSFTLTNTIVASSYFQNCSGTFIDGGHNLQFGDATCGATITVADPKLGPLANNGGPTLTMALQTGSAAINAGDNATCASPLIGNLDQRGNVRPGGGQPNCSIGAYEYP